MSDGEPLRFEMDRLVAYTDEDVLAELRRVASLLPPGPISREAFDAQARMSESTLRKRFGSWRAALDAAGLGDRYTHPGAAATPEQVIADLRWIAGHLGRTTLTVTDVVEHGRTATERSIRRTFGTFSKALGAAGLDVSPHQRRWTDDDYFDNLLEVWTRHGRAPKIGEMGQPPSKITGGAYARKFGSWVDRKSVV